MNTLLEIVASNAVLATLMAVGVAGVTRFVRRPKVAYWLWALVLIKLVTPPVFHLPLSLETAGEPEVLVEETAHRADASPDPTARAERPPAMTEEMARDLRRRVDLLTNATSPGSAELPESAAPAAPPVARMTTQEPLQAARKPFPWLETLVGVWLLGSVFWFALAAVRTVRFGRLLRQAEPAPECLQAAARRLADRFGLKRCPEVRVVAARIPPLLWGSVRGATIVLPSDLICQLTLAEQTALLAHDLAHYRRGDHLVRWAEALILGVFWWHPVVWWARLRMRQAEELCCDAWVLWAFPQDAKRYAHTLLTAVEFISAVRSPLPAIASGVGQIGSLKRRLEMIVNQALRRQMSWPGFAAVVAVAMLVLPWSAGTAPAEVTESATDAEAESAVSPEEPDRVVGDVLGDATPSCRVSGVVVGPDGKPLEGAKVYLVGHEYFHPFGHTLPYAAWPKDQESVGFGLHTYGEATTDTAGRFALDDVPFHLAGIGRADIVVRAEGLGMAFFDWKGNEEVKIEVAKGVAVKGRLLAPDGRPASGVTVQSTWISSDVGYLSISIDAPEKELPGCWPRPVRTDAEGIFTVSGIPTDSSVSFCIRDPSYGEERLTVDTKLESTEISEEAGQMPGESRSTLPPTFTHRLTPPRPVEGVVTAADTGEPFAGMLVEVVAIGNLGGWGIYGRTDEQGRYRINAWEARNYFVHVYPAPGSGYLAVSKSRIQGWPKGAQTLQFDLVLHRGKPIRGQVLDDQTGEPIAGASVVYRPSRGNPHERNDYEFRNPALTGEDGRFTLTAIAGAGQLMVETPHRIYRRTSIERRGAGPTMPAGLTPIDVPLEGTPDEVVIRMKRGRSVTLRVRGPDGETLPSVRVFWDGINAVHDVAWFEGFSFPLNAGGVEKDLVLPGLDPEGTALILLLNTDLKLGAVFEVTPETPAGPVEVRLQPTATVTGQVVTPEGEPDPNGRVDLMLTRAPKKEKFPWQGPPSRQLDYSNFSRAHEQEEPLYPDGRFTLEYILPGLRFGLRVSRVRERSWRHVSTVAMEPFESGQRLDLGKLVVREEPSRQTADEFPAKPFQEATFEGGELKFVEGIPVLFLQGTPEEMGRQHGTLALADIRRAVGLPKQIMGIAGINGVWSRMVLLAQAAREKLPPRYQREFEAGIQALKASQEEIEAVMVANLLMESGLGIPNSALLVEPARSANGKPLFGHGFDLYSFGILDRMSLVTVRRPDHGHALVTVGIAGLFGVVSGMNDVGLTVATLDAAGARDGSPKFDPEGAPVHFTCARLLEECSTVEEAEKLIRSVSHATQMSLAVCDTRRAAVFEVTPRSVVTRGSENYVMAVTNDFRSPELALPADCDRYETLRLAGKRREPFAWSDVAELMQDVEDDALQMMVFEPGALKLHVAIGDPATAAAMVTLDLEELFKHEVKTP